MRQGGTPLDAKVVLLGSASVGKTSIICRAVSNEFDAEMPATIGACYTAKQVDIANVVVNLQIWDTAGQERFRTLAPMYYRGSIVALLVYAINDETSLQDVRNWVDEIRQQTEEMPAIFVVGNKSDLADERKISTDQGQAISNQLGAFFAEVSAKSGRGIDELIIRVAEESVKKIQEGGGGGGREGDGASGVTPAQSTVTLTADPRGGKKKKCKC
jgi:small GTP-binding protein